MNDFDQILQQIQETWNCVEVPGTVSSGELEEWLDENCNSRYYFDPMFLSKQDPNVVSADWANLVTRRKLPCLYFESKDDMIFYNLVWNKYNESTS
jgi:hypothetical protein